MNPSILPSNFVVEKVTASVGEVTITTS